MLRPHASHLAMPPESSQTRRPAADGDWLSLIASRAVSTHSRGMPESGTGTATTAPANPTDNDVKTACTAAEAAMTAKLSAAGTITLNTEWVL